MEKRAPTPSETVAEAELAERLQWLLRLRWLIVPVFVAVDLASDLLLDRPAPWTALVVGAVLQFVLLVAALVAVAGQSST